jgi:hypothetical protein
MHVGGDVLNLVEHTARAFDDEFTVFGEAT